MFCGGNAHIEKKNLPYLTGANNEPEQMQTKSLHCTHKAEFGLSKTHQHWKPRSPRSKIRATPQTHWYALNIPAQNHNRHPVLLLHRPSRQGSSTALCGFRSNLRLHTAVITNEASLAQTFAKSHGFRARFTSMLK